jgi:hypothetical protein
VEERKVTVKTPVYVKYFFANMQTDKKDMQQDIFLTCMAHHRTITVFIYPSKILFCNDSIDRLLRGKLTAYQ